MFTPSDMLLDSLKQEPRDIYDIIGALEGYLNSDPKFETNDFEDAIKYVLNHGISKDELFQPFDSSVEFIEDEKLWDYDYYGLARVYMKDNFCEKRINHVKAIAKKLYPNVKQTSSDVRYESKQNVREKISEKKSQNQVVEKGKTPPKLNATKILMVVAMFAIVIILIALIFAKVQKSTDANCIIKSILK